MATTFADFTGDGNATKAFSFPSIKEADIKVEGDGTVYENRGITGASSGTTTFTITSYTTTCLLYTSPSPRDKRQSRMPSSA